MNAWKKEYANLNKQNQCDLQKDKDRPEENAKNLAFVLVNYTLPPQNQAKMQNTFHSFSTYIAHI